MESGFSRILSVTHSDPRTAVLKPTTSTPMTSTVKISGNDWGVQHTAGIPEPIFKRIDQDGSGGISKAEFSKALSERSHHGGPHGGGPSLDAIFSHIDANSDGLIDQNENDAFLQSVNSPRRAAQSPTKLAERVFKKADADRDGSLTKAELLDALPHHGTASLLEDFFKSVDADNDGKISQGELEEALRKVLHPATDYTQAGAVQTTPAGGGSFSAVA